VEVEFSRKRYGAKDASKSQCAKHFSSGALLDIELWKKRAAVVARSTFGNKKLQDSPRSDHFFEI